MLLSPSVSLRQASAADWPAVERLLLDNKLSTQGARAHLATYLLAISNGEIVGCAGAEVYGNIALLRSVAVAPGLQRQGIGELLVTRLIQEGTRRQLRKLFLLTVTAPEYFARYGFKRGPIELAPAALKASAELQGACPACAAFMSLPLAEPAAVSNELPVAVIGAGPVGLAAAARLIERGIEPIVLEAGSSVGTSLVDYGHVRLFSPWRYDLDPAMAAHDADALPARGQLGSSLKALRDSGRMEFVSGLRIESVRRDGATLTVEGHGPDRQRRVLTGIDRIVCATGQRPDLAMVGELRLRLDPGLESTEALGPLIDPNRHSCGTVRPHGHRELAHPEPGFYTLGVKSYGRAPTFLMATGFEQARSVVAAIAGDLDAAHRVELDLPETGVCGIAPVEAAPAIPVQAAASRCCG